MKCGQDGSALEVPRAHGLLAGVCQWPCKETQRLKEAGFRVELRDISSEAAGVL